MGSPMEGIEIRRDIQHHKFKFKEYFKGFERCPAVLEIFGGDTDNVLNELEIEFSSRKGGYMGVNDDDGCLIINVHHLKKSDERTLYLDVVHELVHVKQFREGKNLFDPNYEYVDRPTEIEAYKHAVDEAKNIGMTDKDIIEYLEVEWLDQKAHKRLVFNVGIKIDT